MALKVECEQFIAELEKLIGRMTADAERHRELKEMNSSLASDTTTLSTVKKHSGEPPEAYRQTLTAIRDAADQLAEFYSVIPINSFLPQSRVDRYRVLRHVKTSGFFYEMTLYTKVLGGNLEALHFMWRIDRDSDSHDAMQADAVKIVDAQLPSYHDKAVKKAFVTAANKLNVKPSHRRLLFHIATSDSTAPANHAEETVNKRLEHYVDTGDESIIVDLRKLNKRPSVFEQFFEKAARFIESEVETAVDDRRHGSIVHMALALSADDLHRLVRYIHACYIHFTCICITDLHVQSAVIRVQVQADVICNVPQGCFCSCHRHSILYYSYGVTYGEQF